MDFATIFELETQLVFLLNLDGWQLIKSEDEFAVFDAYGYDTNGKRCVVEFKFRNDYYDTKMMELKKYDSLMAINTTKKYYCVIDSGGAYMFDLDHIDKSDCHTIDLPKKTITDKPEKKQKQIFFLKKSDAIAYNYNFF